jgi:hypothetical protein
MKLEELVPPLELCKLIPKGEFEDSALVWLNIDYVTIPWKVVERKFSHYKMQRKKQSYPAPTLQEIIKELGVFNLSNYYGDENLYMCDVSFTISEVEESPVIAAFKCWLKTKGIEYEK